MSTLVTGDAVSLRIRPASIFSRALSGAIDYVTYMLVYVTIIVGFAWLFNTMFRVSGLLVEAIATIVIVVCLVLIPTAVETLTRGRSLGRLIVGLRIVREDGGSISFRHAFIRSMLWQLEVLSSAGGIAAVTALCNGRSKRLGDFLAGTVSIAERARRLNLESVPMPPHLSGWAQRADISPIPPGLFYRITQYLASASGQSEEARLRRCIELAEELNPYVAPAPPEGTDPVEFLAATVAATRAREFRRIERERELVDAFRHRGSILPYGLSTGRSTPGQRKP